ncbi:MAG TPA: glycosyltransferase family 2 protein [Gallionella sp.]|nr:glycosyltransferase family 2 protein [Gallionella sp.]
MRVSIVTISFNQVRFLKAAINSIVSQGFHDLEYVVVDPGSTDGSREVIKQYGEQISKLILEPDAGPADGLNKGFACATGEILGFVNADDELLPHSLQFVADYFEEHPEIDVLLGCGWIVDETGRVLRHIVPSGFSLLHSAFGRFEFIQQAVFFRRSVFESIGGFNKLNRISWDGELLVDMAIAGVRFARTEKELGVFRIYPSSISGSSNYLQKLLLENERLFQKIMGRGSRGYDPVLGLMLLVSKWILDPWYVYWRLVRNFRIKIFSPD